MKTKLNSLIGIAVLALAMVLPTGCTTPMNQGDIALLSQDLQDVAREGTIYALAENPQWRANITIVRDQLKAQADNPAVTVDDLLNTLQGLPLKELKSSEARLAITSGKIILRRVGRNVDLGTIQQIAPLAGGLAAGITEGLKPIP